MNDAAIPLAPTAPPDLGGLLDRAAQGDVAAAAAVYDLVSVSAYRLVCLVVGEPELAADICRRGFSHLWSAWTTAVNDDGRPSSPRAWTLVIMYRFATQQTLSPISAGKPNDRAPFTSDRYSLAQRGPQHRRLLLNQLVVRALNQCRRVVR